VARPAARLKRRVPEAAAGQRVDRYVASLPEIESRAEAERLLAAGAVLLDGAAPSKSRRLSGGEELAVELPERPPDALEPEPMELRIAWKDEHLLVVDKPAGVVVHPAPGHSVSTLAHALVEHGAVGGDAWRPGIVHRLDRDTSGLMVVARSEEAHRRLQNLVRRRALERGYLALVVGRPRSRRGRIEAPIGRDRRDPLRHSLDTEVPREAVT
jgi:23S rRNA pseudouridine1911/1915/1917 synthase